MVTPVANTKLSRGTSSERKCESLTTEEADALFFPGSGGKPHKAKAFCSDCPFRKECLQDAIDGGYAGFWSGTTDDERATMKKMNFELQFQLASAMPEPKPKRLRKIVVTEDPHSWLALNGPSPEQIEAQERFLNSIIA